MITPPAFATERLGGEFPAEVLGAKRTGLRDQSARVVHLPPDIPQQHAAHAAVLEVIHDSFAERLLPILDRGEARVEIPDGFVAAVEQVRVEEREVVVWRR